jgi:hypothetical protein
MANSFGTDILIQSKTPMKAANFYVKELGFEIKDEPDFPRVYIKDPHELIYNLTE